MAAAHQMHDEMYKRGLRCIWYIIEDQNVADLIAGHYFFPKSAIPCFLSTARAYSF